MIGPYQPERSKDGKTADVGHAKLEEGEGDDDEIKDVPALLRMQTKISCYFQKMFHFP